MVKLAAHELKIKLTDPPLVVGSVVWCRLTGKQLIVQRLHYKSGVNPQYASAEPEYDKLTVRYLSNKHDEFKTTDVYISEIDRNPPKQNTKQNEKTKY